MEIGINNTRLHFRRLPAYRAGDTKLSSCYNKKKLKYQWIFFRSSSGSKTMLLSICGHMSGPVNIPKVLRSCTEAWVLEKSEKKYNSLDYTKDEKYFLSSMIPPLLDLMHLDVVESIVSAIGSKKLTEIFYTSYGTQGIKDLQDYCTRHEPDLSELSVEYGKIYQRRTYSIYKLLQDLVQDGSMICIDPEILEYTKMSRARKSTSPAVLSSATWAKVIDILGNKKRANLSLLLENKVTVDVPENEYSIPTGPRELISNRSICLVKDGMVWTPRIAVKINNKSLVRKFSGAKILVCNLFYENEYILDLQKLPCINKRDTKVSLSDLSDYECKYIKETAAVIYLEKDLKKEEKSPSTLFLNSLGIYGDRYIPQTLEAPATSSYTTTELVTYFSGGLGWRELIRENKIPEFFKDTLKEVIKEKAELGLLDTIKKHIDLRDAAEKKLRDLKYRIILGKFLYTSDGHYLDRLHFNVGYGEYLIWGIKKKEIKV